MTESQGKPAADASRSPSDPPPDSPPAAPGVDGGRRPAATATEIRRERRRTRWRRLRRIGFVLLILVVVLRLSLSFLLPTVVRKTANQFGFDLTYGRLDLNLMGTQAGIWDVVLSPRGRPDEVLVRADYAFANISAPALFKLKFVAYRLEVDGVRVSVERRSDGSIPLLEQLAAATASGDAPQPPAGASGAGAGVAAPIEFESPFRVEALRLSHVTVDVRDASVDPPFADSVTLDLRVSDVGNPDPARPLTLDAIVFTESTLDSLRVHAEADLRKDRLTATARFAGNGLRPAGAGAYLAALGVETTGAAGGALDLSGEADLAMQAVPGTPGALRGTLTARNLSLRAGGEPAATLARAQVSIAELSPSAVHVSSIDAAGGSLRVRRLPTGRLAFATLSGRAAPPTPPPPTTTAPAPASGAPAAHATSTAPAAPSFAWRLDEFTAGDLEAHFLDETFVPARAVAGRLDSFALDNLAGAGGPDDVTTVGASLSFPGVAEAVELTGEARPFAATPAARLTVDAKRTTLAAVAPYLRPLGVEPTLRSAAFRATVDASVADASAVPAVTLRVTGVQFQDGDEPLFDLPSVRVDGVSLDPQAGAVEVSEIAMTGPSLTIRRMADGSFDLPGFRFRPPAPGVASPEAAGPGGTATTRAAPPAAAPPPLVAATRPSTDFPVVRIGKLTWAGGDVRLEDRSTAGAEPLDLSDASLEVTGFVLDLRPDAPPAPPGKLVARFRSEGLAESLALDGTFVPAPGSLALDVAVVGRGLNGARLAPYLRPAGIEPRLADGALAATVTAKLARRADGLALSGDVREVDLSDAGVRLVGLTRATVDEVVLRPDGLMVGDVAVTGAYAKIERDADGGLIAAGFKRLPPAASPAADPAGTPPTALVSRPAALAPERPSPEPQAPAVVADPFALLDAVPPLSLKSLRLEGVEIEWVDRAAAAAAPVNLVLRADVRVDDVSLNGTEPRETRFALNASSPQLADSLEVAGTVTLARDSLTLTSDVRAAGLKAGAVAPYLPAGVEPALADGALEVSTGLDVRRGDGSLGARWTATGLSFREADWPEPLAEFASLTVSLERLDLRSGDVTLAEVTLADLEGSAVRAADGAIEILGLRLGAPAPAGAALAEPAVADASPPGNAPEQLPPSPPAAEGAAADVRAILAESKQTMPSVRLGSLSVGVKRLSFEDRFRNASPLALQGFTMTSVSPVELFGPKPQENPPVRLALTGAVDPLVERFAVDLTAAPLAERPSLKVSIDASGIRGAPLADVAPELAGLIDGAPLLDGRFQTAIEAEATVRRRGPTEIDLSRGFELNVDVGATSLTGGGGGGGGGKLVLAGIGSARAEQVAIDPRSGGVAVRSVEVADVTANAWRDGDGIHVLGVRVLGTEPPPAAGGPAVADAGAADGDHAGRTGDPAANDAPESPTAPVADGADATAAAADATAAESARPEVRVDRLVVSGLDFRFEDRALDPPVVIPITSGEVELRGLSSLALERERPVRFNVSLGAGKVSLPKPVRRGSIGDLFALAKLDAGATPDVEMEHRDFLAQVVGNGTLQLFPKPAGRATVSVSGVELAAVRGLAASTGVTLGGGTFDGRVELRPADDDRLDVRAKVVLTDLSLSEPPGGPIAQLLALPAPLDVVIGAVEAPDKSITLPLKFQVDGATPEGIVPAAVGAVSQVLVTAVASAPVKTVTGVVGLVGDLSGVAGLLGGGGGSEARVIEEPPVYFDYPVGVTSLDAGAARQLEAILGRVRKDKTMSVTVEHLAGDDDLARAAERANPPADQARVLAERVRARRKALLAKRAELLAPARMAAQRSNSTSGGGDVSGEVGQLRSIGRELAGVEDALDRLYDLQRPGADRRAGTRARAAAIELIDARLVAVRDAASGVLRDVPAAADRVKVAPARLNPSGQPGSRLAVTVVRTARGK